MLTQLMVASTVDNSYVFCGEVGGSVVNALHFGRDPRGKRPFSPGLTEYCCVGCYSSDCAAIRARLAVPVVAD